MTKITAYTDGSAILKYPFKGGSGIYIITPTKELKLQKGFCNTKTGRCELYAVLICLKAIKNKKAIVTIYSDSMYIINTCNLWIDNWQKLNFIDKKNTDLLKILFEEIHLFSIRPILKHIKGHQEQSDLNSNIKNERIRCNNVADRLADYKKHSTYEVDVPFEDLTSFEKEDFYEQNGKKYYKNNK